MEQSDSKFLSILREIGEAIPKLSTDFITPDGIDIKKLKREIASASFRNILPACTLMTDLASNLFKDSKNQGIKDFIGFSRNAIALYSIMDTIHTNIVPSNSMENRADITYWKNIGAKFGINVPICDAYGTSGSMDVPITDILFYLAFKLVPKKEYVDIVPSAPYSVNFTVVGIEGDAPTMASDGAITLTSDCMVCVHCILKHRGTDDVMCDTYYCMQISSMSYKAASDTAAASGNISGVAGGKIISEHVAYVTPSPYVDFDSNRIIKEMLCYMYRGLDSGKYHYFADWSKLTVKPNTEIRCVDEVAWVKSDMLDQLTDECDRVTAANLTRSYALVGPIGTGKTSMCEHIMLDLASRGYTMIRCTLNERYLESSLDRVMTAIQMCSKAVVLLDELDSLDIECKCNEVSMLIDFFAKVQRSGHPVIIFSTMNNPKNIHSTIMGRSGRIDEVKCIGYPDVKMTTVLLGRYFAANGYSVDQADIETVAAELADKDVSVADIKNLASMMLFKHGKKDHYTMDELQTTIGALMSSREAASVNYCSDDQ